ncbi:MAG: isochorismatase family cysteine hydrolase, partial [Bacteroidota bacterium]
MNNTALIVIDMINDYLHFNGKLYCEKCREIIPALNEAIDFAREKNISVIYLNTNLNSDDDLLAKKWGMHAETGTFGAEVIKELEPKNNDVVINKKGYNGFTNTDLDEELKKLGIKNIIISGIHSHVCVLLTAVGGFELGYNITVLQDCISTNSTSIRGRELDFFNTHIGELITFKEWKARFT